MNPQRIQLSRTSGWRKPDNTVVVARPTRWGNPFSVKIFGRELAVLLYGRSITGFWTPTGIPDELIPQAYRMHCWLCSVTKTRDLAVSQLRGKNLACWCPIGAPCHADVLLELANA